MLITEKKNKSIIDFFTNPRNKALAPLQIALLIYTVMLTFPSLIIQTRSDVDFSWYIGLHKAAQLGLTFGKDVLFTYGPLGFLTVPIFIDQTLWTYSALYTIAVYALAVFACCLFLRKMNTNLAKTIVFAIIFITVFKGMLTRPGRDFELVISLLIFTYLYTLSKGNIILLSALAFFYSVLPFIKFSAVSAAAITAAVFIIILIRDKRHKEAAVFLIVSSISFLILGLLLIGSPEKIYMYIYGCLQISSGYNDAMGIEGPRSSFNSAVFSAAFAWVSFLALSFYCAKQKKRNELIYLALGFGALFLGFKLGYIRRDFEHLVLFDSLCLFVFGLFFLKPLANAKITAYVLLFIVFMLYQSSGKNTSFLKLYTPDTTREKFEDLRQSFNLIRGIGREEEIAKVKKQITDFLFLKPQTITNLSGHTMDVFPCDIAVAELYDFKWDPRPIFQSYSVYTPYLDSLNAKHFLSDSAPEYVLYALDSPDFRYAIYEEPETFRTLLQNYKPCAIDGEFIVLRKIPSARPATESPFIIKTAKFNQKIRVPAVTNGLVFAKIYIEHNLLGSITRLFYKSPNVYFTFFRDGKPIKDRLYRFIFSNSANGVLVSCYVKNQEDLFNLWYNENLKNIDEIGFNTPHQAFFKNKITVEFFTIPQIKNQ